MSGFEKRTSLVERPTWAQSRSPSEGLLWVIFDVSRARRTDPVYRNNRTCGAHSDTSELRQQRTLNWKWRHDAVHSSIKPKPWLVRIKVLVRPVQAAAS